MHSTYEQSNTARVPRGQFTPFILPLRSKAGKVKPGKGAYIVIISTIIKGAQLHNSQRDEDCEEGNMVIALPSWYLSRRASISDACENDRRMA